MRSSAFAIFADPKVHLLFRWSYQILARTGEVVLPVLMQKIFDEGVISKG
jgi:hypothetical protein